MIFVIALYTLLSAVAPFIWVFVPARIIWLSSTGQKNDLLWLLVCAGFLAVLTSFGLAFLKGNFRMRMNNIRYNLIRDLMRISLDMPYQNTLNIKTLENIKLANQSLVSPVMGAGGIILTMQQLFGEILASLGFVWLLSTLSPWMMLILLMVVLGTFALSKKAADREEKAWEESESINMKTEFLFNFVKDPANKKDISLFSLYDLIKSYIQNFIKASQDIEKAVSLKTFTNETAIAGLDLIRDTALFGWLAFLFLQGHIDSSLFFLYSIGSISFVVIAQQCMKDIATIRKEEQRFSTFMNLPHLLGFEEKYEASFNGLDLNNQGLNIEVHHLSFSYPGSEKPALNNLNLNIRSGEKLALVGENGSGKSTLIKLLCRLYRPEKGQILVNGMDIWKIPEEAYRELLSVVFQDAMVFPFSVRENIAMSEQASSALLELALEESELKPIVDSLAKGSETTLLRLLDDEGRDLSGGERQKLFLARALYKKNSRFLILDEPSASLDPLAERALYEHYGKMTEGKTSLFVSHRLASTRFCDHIALLEDGKIQEYGTHDSLIALGGTYANLFEIQAKNYRESMKSKEQS
ncbi:MAG: ABC transporter ATP-binding protein [Anaerolineaceae bacterium]|nr:ABC transporter ATP-binding protein [Anaerolineaceae bacterium]